MARVRYSRKKRTFPVRGWLFRLGVIVVAAPVLLTIAYMVINPVSTLVLYRLAMGEPVKQNWQPLSQLSKNLQIAVIMSEDGRYCEHKGVDWRAIEKQIELLDDGERPRGASTLPMQLAKNLFLWHGRSYVRKVFELPVAVWLDFVLGKRRMLEIYLNIAEWGDGIFGADAAARQYFGRSAKSLTPRQAALLAAALPNPFVRNPARPSRTMARNAEIIERRMRSSGAYIKCIAP